MIRRSVYLVITEAKVKAFSSWDARAAFLRRAAKLFPQAVEPRERVCLACRDYPPADLSMIPPTIKGWETTSTMMRGKRVNL